MKKAYISIQIFGNEEAIAEKISTTHNFKKIGIRKLIKKHLRVNTSDGKEIAEVVEKGELVSYTKIMSLLEKELQDSFSDVLIYQLPNTINIKQLEELINCLEVKEYVLQNIYFITHEEEQLMRIIKNRVGEKRFLTENYKNRIQKIVFKEEELFNEIKEKSLVKVFINQNIS